MRTKFVCRSLTLLFPMLLCAAPAQHTMTAKLDYDFKRFHACKEKDKDKDKHPCIAQFNIYDLLSRGKPVKLFSIPAPDGAKKRVKSITGDSGPVTLDSGTHTFGATAQLADGKESDPWLCTVSAVVGPGSRVALNIPMQ